MRIPEQQIEQILNSVDIVDIISEHVKLRKRGKNFIGLCPFHTEKTPSFSVSSEKQIYHCFGCHAGGNVFKFLMEFEKISFVESVQEVADRVGIEIQYDEKYNFKSSQTEQEILYDINTEAAKYFSNNLLHSKEGEIARNYFANRNIKTQTIRTFGLGYAFEGWEYFVQWASENKIDLDKAYQLGLIGKNSEGNFFDKFMGRIIFPIFSPNGRVVAFAGRVINNREGVAKYLNSPESIIYYKGKILYGLSHAKDEIRKLDRAVLVEGYMDLISLYQNGIKNVVAVSGTALTDDQAQLLSRYTKNVVLLFDSDLAGMKASMRSIEILLKKDFEIKIVTLPQGEDPDSYINKHSKEQFDELVQKGENFFEFLTAYYSATGMFEDASKTAQAIRSLVKLLALVDDQLKRNLLIKSIAKKFGLREKVIESELEKFLKPSSDLNKKTNPVLTTATAEKLSTDNRPIEKSGNADYNLERELLKLLFEGSKEITDVIFCYLKPEDFSFDIHQYLAQITHDVYLNGEDLLVNSIVDTIEDERVKSYLLELIFDKYTISKSWDEFTPSEPENVILKKIAIDSLKKFIGNQYDQKIKANHDSLEQTTDELERIRLMKLNKDLMQEKISSLKEIENINFN